MTQSIVDDIDTSYTGNARIKVIGVGGAGGNAVKTMIESGLHGVQFISANTDLQALNNNPAPVKVQLGEQATRGLGAGADPAKGREAALESKDRIRDAIGDADMVFITAGMGGGTGTGGAPVVAQVAKEMEKLTVGVVTKPFTFEGPQRSVSAEAGVEELKKYVDSLIVIPNDRLQACAGKKVAFLEMLNRANDVLYYAVKGISDAILCPGLINVDFADVCTTMRDSGLALMGTGMASGETRAREAAQKAISSPLLEDSSLDSARSILYNITAGQDLGMDEVGEIGDIIRSAAPEARSIIFGVVFDDSMGEDLRITLIGTGIDSMSSAPLEEQPVAKVTAFSPRPEAVTPVRGVARQQIAMPDEPPMRESARFSPRNAGEWYSEQDAEERPAYVARRSAYARRGHVPGQTDMTFGENLDVPTFLRKQAD